MLVLLIYFLELIYCHVEMLAKSNFYHCVGNYNTFSDICLSLAEITNRVTYCCDIYREYFCVNCSIFLPLSYGFSYRENQEINCMRCKLFCFILSFLANLICEFCRALSLFSFRFTELYLGVATTNHPPPSLPVLCIFFWSAVWLQ